MQAVFQNPFLSLSPRCRIRTLLTESLEASARLSPGQRQAAAEGLLDRVGLPTDLARRYPHQLSGGQRQRVVIARALANNPSVIVLDEPLSALDVSVRAHIVRLLREIRQDTNVSFVYITHDLATVPHLTDRAYVLHRGRVVEELPSAHLHDAQEDYTKELLAAAPSLRRRA